MKTLRKIFGTDIPEPIDYQITRWSSDPYVLGSYSFNPVGTQPKLRRQLATPLADTLYFAGEATEHNYFGTAHGA
jgi:monoamine oxidase